LAIEVFVKEGKAITTSLKVAEIFRKKHYNVLRDIQGLDCSQEFRALNFELSSYISEQNKEMPMYFITKDGFMFLVMGYTGEKAAQLKEGYIKAFNKMEQALREMTENTINNYIVSQAMNKIEQYTKKVTNELSQMSLFPMDTRLTAKLHFKRDKKKLSFNLSYEEHKMFKEYCAKQNLSMIGAIEHFIEECINYIS
jgi:Rha family phage regulatory protein